MDSYQDLPPEALDDPFKPPERPRMVRCLHCDQTYTSSLMKWRGGLWRCGIPGCDGAGYGFDVFDEDNNLFADEDEEDFGFDGDFDLDIDFESTEE